MQPDAVPARASVRALAVAALTSLPPAVFAGPPFLTDDPDPVDRGHAEANLIAQQTRAADGRSGSVSGEVNLGCAAQVQCHVALPVAFDHPGGGVAQRGLGDAELGLKVRFLDLPDSGWSAAVYPTVDLPTGNAARGLGNGRTQLLLPLWVQRASGDWRWDAGVARLIARAPGEHDSWFAGVLAQCSLGDRLSVGAELFGRTSTAEGVPSTTGFNVGAVASLAPGNNLLISAGRGLPHAESNRASMFLAYQLER